LYRLVPESWCAPNVPWRVKNRAQFWASNMEYFAAMASPHPAITEKMFRWHLFSWFLTNLAAMSYSDLVLDIDKVHDDADYRSCVVDEITAEVGSAPNFQDLKKFDRYYEFESFEVGAVCDQVVSTISETFENGSLEQALVVLGKESPTIPTRVAFELLLEKLDGSRVSMANSTERRYMPAEEWRVIADKNRRIWFNPIARRIAEQVHPLAAPVIYAVRRARLWN
jgi:hypothetical protein